MYSACGSALPFAKGKTTSDSIGGRLLNIREGAKAANARSARTMAPAPSQRRLFRLIGGEAPASTICAAGSPASLRPVSLRPVSLRPGSLRPVSLRPGSLRIDGEDGVVIAVSVLLSVISLTLDTKR